METSFITDKKGKKKGVMLSYSNYKKLLDDQDELACIKEFDTAIQRTLKTKPAEIVFDEIEKKRKTR